MGSFEEPSLMRLDLEERNIVTQTVFYQEIAQLSIAIVKTLAADVRLVLM